jgi:hypothetical protein|eukprot:COSAG06_NODE_221_length_19912_cov_17.460875_16_plen_188_part_00
MGKTQKKSGVFRRVKLATLVIQRLDRGWSVRKRLIDMTNGKKAPGQRRIRSHTERHLELQPQPEQAPQPQPQPEPEPEPQPQPQPEPEPELEPEPEPEREGALRVIKVGSVDDVLSALSKSPKQVLQLTDFAIEFFRAKVVATDGGDEVDFEQFLGAKNKTAARFGFLAFVPWQSWEIKLALAWWKN